MSGKVKTGHWELASCLVEPPVIMAAMIVVGFVHGQKQEQILAQRARLLDLIPVLEKKAGIANQAMKPFIVPVATKDMAADLSLCVSDAAQKYGFVIRSSNVEKQADPGAGGWIDYKLTLTGEGPLASLIAMLDYLGQPQRRFNAVHVSLTTTRLTPETICSADLVLASRVVVDRSGDSGAGQVGGVITPATAGEIGMKAAKAAEGVRAWIEDPVTPLSLKNLQNRVLYVPPAPTQTEIEPQVTFRLTGIVREKTAPMIMTDRGVFGVGAEVDGFKIEAIGDDRVTVVSKGGRRETVKLYKGGSGM